MKCAVCDEREEYRDSVCFQCMKDADEDPDLEEYHELVAAKNRFDAGGGFNVGDREWPHLFPFQRDVLRWSLRRGRAAAFLDTGLGKTRLQVTFADEVLRHQATFGMFEPGAGRFLILAPLAVAQQTIAEAASFGVEVRYVRSAAEVRPGISITNYEMLHALDPLQFVGVALDESSILKNFDGKTRTAIIEAFERTPYKLACTATPSPNDFTELGNHAEFLGVMTRAEMLAMYFVHDGGSTQDWRLKGHARRRFWQWVCSWAALVRRPSDLGYPDDGYILPSLEIVQHTIQATPEQARAQGKLFVEPAKGLAEQRAAKRATMPARVAKAAEIVAAEPGEQFLVWCELNDESTGATKSIPDAIEVTGSHPPEVKAERLLGFARGTVRDLVTKVDIAGMGLNFQSSARQVFVGPTNSFEGWYQAVRRQWRFGQSRPVVVHVIASELDGNILENLRRKQAEAEKMGAEMAEFTRDFVRAQVRGTARDITVYDPQQAMQVPQWLRSEEGQSWKPQN
jgi:hypothetical protein